MAMISLKEWLDWWESKGKAISYCYIGNGGKVVTPGTSSQVGTSVTVGGSMPGNAAPRPSGEAPGDGQAPIPVTARVVSSVTTTETIGNSSTPNVITTTTIYSNGVENSNGRKLRLVGHATPHFQMGVPKSSYSMTFQRRQQQS